MNILLEKLKINIRGDNIALPEAKNITPIIYYILFFITVISVASTIFVFSENKKFSITKNSLIKQKTYTPKTSNLDINQFNSILNRNIFNIDGTVPDASETGTNICSQESKKSSLAYIVTGIIFGGTAQTSTVLLEKNNDQNSEIYKFGDTLLPGVTISNITENRVYITGKSCPEYLEINYPILQNSRRAVQQRNTNITYSESGFERNGNTTNVTKQWINDVINNKLSTTLEDARAVPYLVGGQIKGFSVTEITQNSVYSKLGLQNGDVVSTINGVALNDAARAIQTLNSLRNESSIELDIIRDGQPVVLKVNVQ